MYECNNYDEKKIKPPKGLFKVKQERITVIDEMMAHGKQQPAHYDAIDLVSLL